MELYLPRAPAAVAPGAPAASASAPSRPRGSTWRPATLAPAVLAAATALARARAPRRRQGACRAEAKKSLGTRTFSGFGFTLPKILDKMGIQPQRRVHMRETRWQTVNRSGVAALFWAMTKKMRCVFNDGDIETGVATRSDLCLCPTDSGSKQLWPEKKKHLLIDDLQYTYLTWRLSPGQSVYQRVSLKCS